MSNEFHIRDRVFGQITVYRGYRAKEDSFDLTVYIKSPETYYRLYPRDEFNGGEVSKTEVDWRGYIIGGRSHRFDYEVPANDWNEWSDKEKNTWIVESIQSDFDNDEVFGFHVEKIQHNPKWDELDNKELWAVENEIHKRLGDLEVEIREARRQYNLIWALGDSKFQWGDDL